MSGRPRGSRNAEPQNPERVRLVIQLWRDGLKYQYIGLRAGISTQAAHGIVKRWGEYGSQQEAADA